MKKCLSQAAAVILAVAISATLFGCGKEPAVNNNIVNADFSEFLVTEKVGIINRDDFSTTEGGLYYKDENGMYGVMSHEGLHDTGAVYALCEGEGKYFAVSKKLASSHLDYAGLNSVGLIDGKGNTIVPMIYATFDVLNEKYIKVTSVTERIYNKDEALVYYTDKTISLSPSDEDSLYAGKWQVYDITTGKLVPGVSGTKNVTVYARGNYITYTDDADIRKTVDGNGTALPEDAQIFDDGSYCIEGKVGDVYDTNGTKLFSYDLTGFIPSNLSENEDYYIAHKYIDGTSKYVVMDKKGNIVSAEFEDSLSVYGDIIECNNKIYNFEGKNIISGDYTGVYEDEMFGDSWFLYNNDAYTMIDKNGSVFYADVYDDDHTVDTSEFLACEKKDGDYYYYSHKDKDYTIKGYGFAPWIVKTSGANSLYNLVDTMTGNTILEGYSNYSYTARNSFAYYVFAKYNGGADVYLIVAGSQLEDVAQKKVDLLNDLVAAFEAEGIKVSINKESGEMSLDSSVLFGGDSSELTADGKSFLNKFIKVYTSVAFSDKYAGFISKTMVEGHTAPVAGSTYASGLQLSEERAANVKNYCLSAETGVDVSKISGTLEAMGYSNSQPVYGSGGEVDMAASRRVSFRFMVNVDF